MFGASRVGLYSLKVSVFFWYLEPHRSWSQLIPNAPFLPLRAAFSFSFSKYMVTLTYLRYCWLFTIYKAVKRGTLDSLLISSPFCLFSFFEGLSLVANAGCLVTRAIKSVSYLAIVTDHPLSTWDSDFQPVSHKNFQNIQFLIIQSGALTSSPLDCQIKKWQQPTQQ